MKLLKLTLSNFQGIKHFELNADGANLSVYGKNGTGKTTLYNAFTWLLFGKSSTDETNYSPKSKDNDGKYIHHIENSVTATFELDGGEILTLRKVLKEDWRKKRGNEKAEFDGNVTEYYKDSIPVQKKDYDASVARICPSGLVPVLTKVDYFSEVLPWTERRKMLLDICGDVSDEDIIARTPGLEELTRYITKPGTTNQRYTVEEYAKKSASELKLINNRLELIPSLISELMRSMNDTGDGEQLAVDISVARTTIDTLNEELANLNASEEIAKINTDIQIKSTELVSGRGKIDSDYYAATTEKRRIITDMRQKRGEIVGEISYTSSKIKGCQEKLADMKATREKLTAIYSNVRGREIKANDTCPTCGQALPADKVEAATEKLNLDKSEELESIRAKIESNCSKTMIAALEDEIKALEGNLTEAKEKAERLRAEIDKAEADMPICPTFEDTAEYAAIRADIVALEQKRDKLKDSTVEAETALRTKINAVQSNLDKLLAEQAAIKANEKTLARTEELKTEQKALSVEYQDIQKGLYLCENFTRAKVAALNERVNIHFATVRFRMFKEQINGGISECCEPMIPCDSGLVPYASANNAARINTGIEIIDTLSKHFGFVLPIFVDNAESVCELIYTKSQIIRLVVSAADKTLRTVVDDADFTN